jgi:hypothetical protein
MAMWMKRLYRCYMTFFGIEAPDDEVLGQVRE